MSLRRHDVEQWMSHRRLPDELGRLFHKQYALDMDLLWVPTNMIASEGLKHRVFETSLANLQGDEEHAYSKMWLIA
ncbi:probable cyclic nucleotide-gated ion channel 20, chloroplastic isoform X3 [Rosa rugosa]|uniref:probable cyclic nucleotide-gated ion channel 20, chloroplastic isoform X3 n=1 Tax=Rosa rugosa TaxID=74645 RepID=UPI002B400842|nr:probable cyclic nucleotide-gated ion channel 20, chloroplastic isoform X3 [Rosa rugosa]